ncbi:DNA-binding response regulator, NarL/FixJ family, contains REC and HTH domains [Tindallia magadiensis]|uniref:Stage 0 sporulation protein A homolog n=1 Tax=Tindallia magadiensis TaxID=69895 RepID=A0A1I3ATG8_9FIRM|nr:response regulator transcription factor [Tindallia magadiensis]SFH53395.1 DNA-binding response regulator, NarL/FixJ family, contains REC and HTH domains [Tindallia magadiensis]
MIEKNTKKKVMLVDDHKIVRLGLKGLIEKDEDLTVCSEAASLKEMYDNLDETNPHIVLLDMQLPDGDGTEGVREIKKRNSDIRVLILTAYAEDFMVQESIKNGADGYLLKNVDGKAIVQAIHNVLHGLTVMDQKVQIIMSQSAKEDPFLSRLSEREQTILALVSQGKTNKEIGEKLFLAEKTVRNLITKIMRNIEVTNRTEAAGLWLKHMSRK